MAPHMDQKNLVYDNKVLDKIVLDCQIHVH